MLITFLAILVISCSKDDDGVDPEAPVGTNPPVELECEYDDLTLTNDPEAPVDYLLTCNLDVNGTLIIEPGTVIMLEEGVSVLSNSAESAIIAEGTADQPIIFTGTYEEKGAWGYIYFANQSPQNILKHCIIEYGGGASDGHGDAGNILVEGETEITIENCKVTHSEEFGLFVYGDNTKVQLANNVFTKNNYPLNIRDANVNIPSISDDYTGNVNDRIIVMANGQIVKKTTWKKANVPYLVQDGTIGIYEELTIEPGTIIEMGPGTGFSLDGSPGHGLKIVGTPTEKIIIRGELGMSGSWLGINYDGTHPMNEIGYAEISGAGQPDAHGAIYMWYEAKLYIHHTTIKNVGAPACAIYGEVFDNPPTPNPNFSKNNLNFENVPCEIYWEGA